MSCASACEPWRACAAAVTDRPTRSSAEAARAGSCTAAATSTRGSPAGFGPRPRTEGARRDRLSVTTRRASDSGTLPCAPSHCPTTRPLSEPQREATRAPVPGEISQTEAPSLAATPQVEAVPRTRSRPGHEGPRQALRAQVHRGLPAQDQARPPPHRGGIRSRSVGRRGGGAARGEDGPGRARPARGVGHRRETERPTMAPHPRVDRSWAA